MDTQNSRRNIKLCDGFLGYMVLRFLSSDSRFRTWHCSIHTRYLKTNQQNQYIDASSSYRYNFFSKFSKLKENATNIIYIFDYKYKSKRKYK